MRLLDGKGYLKLAGLSIAATVLLPGAAGIATMPVIATAPLLSGGVQRTFPGGLNLHAVPEAPQRMPLAPSSSYDPNRVDDKYAEWTAASAPKLAADSGPWRDVGPLGLDDPTGYGNPPEQFLRVAGMGTALAADSNDPSGNTVYYGNFGGLWKSTNGGDNWSNLSDGKLASVGIGAIALDPSRPGDLYVGTGVSYLTISGDTYGTGFYVSHDGGQTFSRPSPNVSGWAVTRIQVTPSAVLVGTNHGLYRSTDHGDSLTLVPLPDNAAHNGPASGPYGNWISDIAIRPGHPDEITVAVGFGPGKLALRDGSTASPGNGLYRSITGGTAGSFTALDVSGLKTIQSSHDPVGRISLAYGQAAGTDNVLWALVSDAGLTDGLGVTDTAIGDAVGNPTSTTLNGLFRSDDDGTSWTAKATPTTLLTAPNSTLTPAAALNYAPGVQSDYEVPLATDPVVADQVYFGLEEAYQTIENAGANPLPALAGVIERYADICGFYLYTPPVTNGVSCPASTPLYGGYTTHPDQHAMLVVKTPSGSRMYSANDGGVFRQDSHALVVGTGFDNNSWTDLNTMPSLEAWHVAMLPSGEILAALQDNGVSLSGADRKGIQVGVGDGVYGLPTPDSNVFYISSPGGSMFVTKDHGHNLTTMSPSLTAGTFLSPIAIDPTDPNHLLAAGRNVEESLKGPNTTVLSDPVLGHVISTDWTQSFDAGASPTTDPFSGAAVNWTATALADRGASAYGALCATCSAYRESFDTVHAMIETNVKAGCTAAKGGSACWHLASSKGLSPGYVAGLVMDPGDTNTVYASIIERQFVGYPSSTVPGRVFVSHDAGENFTDITGNLPRGSVWRLVIRGGEVIAATDIGMYSAPAGGGGWSRFGTGLPHVAVRDVWIDPSGRYLLASAYGRGIWLFDTGSTALGSNSPDLSTPNSSRQRLTTAGALALIGGPLLMVAVLISLLPRRRRNRQTD